MPITQWNVIDTWWERKKKANDTSTTRPTNEEWEAAETYEDIRYREEDKQKINVNTGEIIK